MIPGLPNPYLLLATLLALLGSFVAGDLYRGRQDKIAYDGAVAGLQRDAATTLAAETAKAAAADAHNAELSNQLDSAHAQALADIDATRDDFARRLRIAAASRVGRCGPAAAEAANPSLGAPVAVGSDGGPGAANPGLGLRAAVRALQEYSKTCNAWALDVGR